MELKDKCGLFGVYNSPTASKDIYLGLYAQQHRGQESAGMVVCSEDGSFNVHKGIGLVTNVFNESTIEKLKGGFGIGHVRYSTSGDTDIKNIQPIVVSYRNNVLGLAHNGNLINALRLREELEDKGSIFTTTSDTEVMLHKIVKSQKVKPVDKIVEGLYGVEGAFSILLLFEMGIAAVRDPWGFRPLFFGKRDDSFYFASETCAFDLLGVNDYREVEPGEGYYISEKRIEKFRLLSFARRCLCIFELIYFSRPDSTYKGSSIHNYRLKLGMQLYKDQKAEADMVISVPDSSNSAALGYSLASGIPFNIVMIRSHYTGRTFIAPYQSIRDFKVKKKFNIIKDVVKDKRVVVVDDSIVRGTTAKKIVKLIRESGAKEIHLRIASPMIRYPCYFGIDMPDFNELFVNKIPSDKFNGYIGADSIGYLKLESLQSIFGNKFCKACFDGQYPMEIKNIEDTLIKKTKQGR
ncbi:MAG: amidophosphoribosyltransferase [Candidatus Hydrogenedentota bacterium]